jgi:hypothetical protein
VNVFGHIRVTITAYSSVVLAIGIVTPNRRTAIITISELIVKTGFTVSMTAKAERIIDRHFSLARITTSKFPVVTVKAVIIVIIAGMAVNFCHCSATGVTSSE